MSLTYEIILWTTSLLLAVFGLTFGIKAAINSNKANNKLKELIATTWISEESEKIFFRNIKEIVRENRLTLLELKKKNCTYQRYNKHGAYTRLNPVSKSVIDSLKNTEYSDLIDLYMFLKREQDEEFVNAINAHFELLTSRKIIGKKIVNLLIEHHQKINAQSKLIMKKYVEVTQ